MAGSQTDRTAQNAISASWERCEIQHKLKRDTSRPILRLQSSEIAPRLEEMIELTGGRQGIFRQLAGIAADAGHCLVVTDIDGILVRLENNESEADWNGIALGSVWDERTAGTNGVSMALAEGREFTVRGKDHFYSQLKPFACTGVPLRNAQNDVIGTANLACIDRSNPANYLFAQQLLGAAADRVQRTLFEKEFADHVIVSIANPVRRDLLRGAELVAVDNAGTIVGSTSLAHKLARMAAYSDLIGNRFDAIFGADIAALDRIPGRVLSVRSDRGPRLDLWTRRPIGSSVTVPGWRPKSRRVPIRRRLPPSLKELTIGSTAMIRICEQAEDCVQHGLPLLIQGETGTGKSALVSALVGDRYGVVTIDCAALGDTAEDRGYFRSLIEQARISGTLNKAVQSNTALVFDNVDELPLYAQAELRALLAEMETHAVEPVSEVRILATCRRPLDDAVHAGTFRDDLFFLLSGSRLELPPLRHREGREALAKALATGLADAEVVFSPEAGSAIASHDWPGNVRELRNALRQALLNGDGARITALGIGMAARPALPKAQRAQTPALHGYDETALLMDALQGARWNVSKAARTLGMGRATIHRKMKALGISRPT